MLGLVLSLARERDIEGLRSLVDELEGEELVRARLHIHSFEYEEGRVREALTGLAWVRDRARPYPGVLCEAHTNSGHAYQLVGAVRKAEEHFRAAVEIAPDLPRLCDSLNGLARLFWDSMAYREARSLYERAARDCAKCPAQINSLTGIAKCDVQLGELREADVSFARVEALLDGAAPMQAAYYRLRRSELHTARCEFSEAKQLLTDALNLAVGNEWLTVLNQELWTRVAIAEGTCSSARVLNLRDEALRQGYQLHADRAVLMLCDVDPELASDLVEAIVHPAIRLRCHARLGTLTTSRFRLFQSRLPEAVLSEVVV